MLGPIQPIHLLFASLVLASVLALGIVLLWLVRVITAPPELAADDRGVVPLVILGWLLVITGLATAALIVCFTLMGPLFGLLAVVVGLVVLGMAFLRNRRGHQDMLLAYLAVAAERLIPLAPAIDAFAEERWGLLRTRARRLAALIRAGVSLPDALLRTPGLVSHQAQATIRAGQQSGSLARALRDVVQAHELHASVWNQTVGRAIYLGLVILFAGTVVTPFMLIKIAPAMQEIFAEFDAAIPPLTQIVFGMANFVAQFAMIFVPLFFLFVLYFLLLLLQYVLGVRWSLPLVGRLTRRLDTAEILESLAIGVERNVSLTSQLETLARWHPRGWVRRRLRRVLQDVNSGIQWAQSMALRGLIRPVELAVFQSAGRAGNLPWALREMAESNRRRLNYRLYLAVQVMFPLAILALGCLVAIHVLGYFLPLISLIQNLT